MSKEEKPKNKRIEKVNEKEFIDTDKQIVTGKLEQLNSSWSLLNIIRLFSSRIWHSNWDSISKGITSIIGLSGLIISVITLIYVANNAYMTGQNIKLVEKSILKDLPAEFKVNFQRRNGSEEITIKNVSRVEAQDITIVVKIYYVDSDGNIISNEMLEKKLTENEDLLTKFQKANILNKSTDLAYVLGRKRTLFIGEIEAEGTRFFDDFFSSTIDNAYKISKVLGTQLIARVRIDYRIKTTLKKQTDYEFIWLHESKKNQYQPIEKEGIIREDLTVVIGGKAIIDKIVTFENNTKEVIFFDIESN